MSNPDTLRQLAGHTAWLANRLQRHRGSVDVVRQASASELGRVVSLHTVERAVSELLIFVVMPRLPAFAFR